MKLQNETYERPIDAVHGRWYGDACGAAFAMELMGERWTLLVVRELMLGPRRFSDIRAELPGISAKVLTERLDRLEEIGVLIRRKLPPPSGAQVYELTEWGLELETVTQALGRWAVRSPLHDPSLPLTSASFLLSLRTMIDPEKAADLRLTALFHAGADNLVTQLADGELSVARNPPVLPEHDLVFKAASVSQFLGVFYGKRDAAECGVTIKGNAALCARFVAAFALPAKCPFPSSES